jgi:hypothetical protein
MEVLIKSSEQKVWIIYLTSLPFDAGYAIIGGALGNGRDEWKELLTWHMPTFEEGDRKTEPRHLLGIADEESIRNQEYSSDPQDIYKSGHSAGGMIVDSSSYKNSCYYGERQERRAGPSWQHYRSVVASWRFE